MRKEIYDTTVIRTPKSQVLSYGLSLTPVWRHSMHIEKVPVSKNTHSKWENGSLIPLKSEF